MESNLGIWGYYQEGFIDPLYRPYTRTLAKDASGRTIDVNRTPYTSLAPTGPIDPGLVRKGWGLRFQLQFPDDPCPTGFSKGEDGYCYRHEPEFQPVFYSDKAFLARKQYWGGFVDSQDGPFGTLPLVKEYRPSNTFDLRSVNPTQGNFHVYFPGYSPRKNRSYSGLATRESYLA